MGFKRMDHFSLMMKGLEKRLRGSIFKEGPNVKWDDIAGLDIAKEELQEAAILPIRFPRLFSGKRKERRGILLYGPPGAGKSFVGPKMKNILQLVTP